MGDTTNNENPYAGCEYKEVTVSRGMETVYVDNYPSFGWLLDESTPFMHGSRSVNLKFKRDRDIRNKAELTRLQRHFENCVKEVERLERSKIIGANAVAYAIGIIGTVFMAGSVLGSRGGIAPLSIILAVPAFVGWIIPFFCYKRILDNQTEKVFPLIDKQYDSIYDVCRKASKLLVD